MVMRRYTLLALLMIYTNLALTTSQKFVYPTDCAPPNQYTRSQSLSDFTMVPPIPSIPSSYQTRVEGNLIDKNLTVVITEYYDHDNKRGAIHLFRNNTLSYQFFDYVNNQTIIVRDGVCTVVDLEPINHYILSSSLYFAQRNGLKYMGQSTVRSIPADHWQSCMYWPDVQANFTLDYFFTAYSSAWVEPDNSTAVPLRAEVRGVQMQMSETSGWMDKPTEFHHIYEYFDFRHSVTADSTVFEVPPGTVCQGWKQTKDLPSLGPAFSYTEEVIGSDDNSVSYIDVWYDFDMKVLRSDYRPYPQNSSNPITLIQDFNTGVAYHIDQGKGNCSIQPIQNSFGSSKNVSDGLGGIFIQMKNPYQFFFLDKANAAYEGTRTVRGLLCDVFTSRSTQVFAGFNASIEFYFLNDVWQESNNGGTQNRVESNIPVQAVFNIPDIPTQFTYNIYNFDKEPISPSAFDVSSCYETDWKQSFYIQFEVAGQYDAKTLDQYRKSFVEAARQQIQTVGHFSPISVQNLQMHVAPTIVYIQGTLLPQPSDLLYFQKSTGEYEYQPQNKIVPGISASDCASHCNSDAELNGCNSFEFCAQISHCSLSTTRMIPNQWQGSNIKCTHYTRTVQKQTTNTIYLHMYDGWLNLKNNVYAGEFTIKIAGLTYTATGIDKVDIDLLKGVRQPASQILKNQFQVHKNNNGKTGSADIIHTGLSVDECSKLCVEQNTSVCNSFSYCFDTGYCSVYRTHIEQVPSAVAYVPICDLYSRAYMSEYKKFPGMTAIHNTAAIYQTVNSEELCAQLCSNYDDQKACKSFDFCPGTSTCYLGRTRHYDTLSMSMSNQHNSTQCNHYARNSLVDFIEAPSGVVNHVDLLIQNTSLEQCAGLCIDQTSFNCTSFSLCDTYVSHSHTETIMCGLSRFTSLNVTTGNDVRCHLYKRIFFEKQNFQNCPATNVRTTVTQKSSTASGTTQPSTNSGTTQPNTRSGTTQQSTSTGKTQQSTSTGRTRQSTHSDAAQTGTTQIGKISGITQHFTTATKQTNNVDCSVCMKSTTAGSPRTQNNCTNPISTNQRDRQKSDNNSFSSGGVVGLAIGMLLVGLLVGGVGVFCVIDRLFRRRSRDEMSVAFVNKPEEH